MSGLLASIVQAVGILVVAFGVGLYSAPAGVIVCGLGIVAFGLAAERSN